MTLEEAKAAVGLLNEKTRTWDEYGEPEEDDYSLHEDYSGRFMFGMTTPAISGPCPILIGWALGRVGVRLDRVQRDSMGLGVVVY